MSHTTNPLEQKIEKEIEELRLKLREQCPCKDCQEENQNIGKGCVIRAFAIRIATHAREEEGRRLAELIHEYYEERKEEPVPYGIPSASPSVSHYKERTMGFLSGILQSYKIITNEIPKDLTNTSDT